MIAGVLLAAGASQRMGSPKALVRVRGQSFLVRGVRGLWAACDRVLVVLGADANGIQERVSAEFGALVEKGLLAPDLKGGPKGRKGELEVHFAVNSRWRQGMYSSARLGLAGALAMKPRGILLQPVDHPEVSAATIQALGNMLLGALGSFGGKSSAAFPYALVPRHRGHRGHPVALSSALAAAIVRDVAARDLGDAIRRNARLIGYLDVGDRGILVNRNTPGRNAKR